ncbi:MAG: hypothetical protein MRY83_20670 [Flavobacteriales bacterium]|nr:hypothetical protein [Flavobacteriales bacterium]
MKTINIYVLGLVALILASCGTSKVVTDGLVMKRKYNKGFYSNFGKTKSKVAKEAETKDLAEAVSKQIDSKESSIALPQTEELAAAQPLTKQAEPKAKTVKKQQIINKIGNKVARDFTQFPGFHKKNTAKYDTPGLSQTAGSEIFATLGLVFSILGLLLFWIPFVGFLFSLIGVVFSILGLKSDKKGASIAGLVIGALGLILGSIWIFAVAAVL